MRFCLGATALMLSSVCMRCYAIPVTYTEVVNSTLFLNGNQLPYSSFVLTGMGDTSNLSMSGGLISGQLTNFSILFGSTTAYVTGPTTVSTSQEDGVSFSEQNGGFTDFVQPEDGYSPDEIGVSTRLIEGTEGQSVYGAALLYNDLNYYPSLSLPFQTDLGSIELGEPHSLGQGAPAMFTTTVSPTPEPSSIALFGTGLIGALGIMRRCFTRSV